MNRRVLAAAVASLASTPSCVYAQVAEVVHMLEWREVVAGTSTPVPNPDGVLQPGEAVRLILSVSYTPVGTPVVYQQPLPGGIAPLAALRTAVFNVIATSALGGTWSDFGSSNGFFAFVSSIPAPDGSLDFCGFGQGSPPLGSSPISTNPLPGVWEAVWTPSTYAARVVGLELRGIQQLGSSTPAPPNMFVSLGLDPQGNPLFGASTGLAIYGGGVTIPIVPSPGAAVVLPLAFACSRRRSRRR